MSRLGASIDIGEELGENNKINQSHLKVNKKQDKSWFSPETEKPEQVAISNVKLAWERTESGGDPPSTNETKGNLEGPKENFPTSKWWIIFSGFLILVIVAFLAWYSFSQAASFPGVDKAVEEQMLEGLRMEVSKQISKDYRTVSEVRKRQMFQERFLALKSDPNTRKLIREKQEKTRSLFQDENGLAYLYTPEGYRYAQIARQVLSHTSSGEGIAYSVGDQETGKAIASFHSMISWIGISHRLEWSAVFFPVGVGVLIAVLVSLIAWAVSGDPFAGLMAGVIATAHPSIVSIFSAGVLQESLMPLLLFWVVVASWAMVAGSSSWLWRLPAAVFGLAAMKVSGSYVSSILVSAGAGVFLFFKGKEKASGVMMATGIMLIFIAIGLFSSQYPFGLQEVVRVIKASPRIVTALASIGAGVACWNLIRKQEGGGKQHDLGLAAAVGVWVGGLFISAQEPSLIIGPLTSSVVAGLVASRCSYRIGSFLASFGTKQGSYHFQAISAVLIAAGLALMVSASSSPSGLLLPGIDDSLAGAQVVLQGSPRLDTVFITDPRTADALTYFSDRQPVLSNSSPKEIQVLFAKALMSDSNEEAFGWLRLLGCPLQAQEAVRTGDLSLQRIAKLSSSPGICPANVFLVIGDQTWGNVLEYAKQAGVETYSQQPSGISSCEALPQGGILCQNGFQIIGLNATRKNAFPARMISFIGKKRVVDYSQSTIEGSFIIFRSGEKLFSMIVPSSIESSLVVRALAHDTVPFLKEVYAKDYPTHHVVYEVLKNNSVS